jgi:hypothetical protein
MTRQADSGRELTFVTIKMMLSEWLLHSQKAEVHLKERLISAYGQEQQ